MTLRVTSLASGSSGNALLVQSSGSRLLVDCGISQRAIERYLRRQGLHPSDLDAILLTHEHGDHTLSAGPLARRYGMPVLANAPTVAALGAALDRVDVLEIDLGGTLTVGDCAVRCFPVPHDAAAPVGYIIETNGWSVGVAIDLGSWDAAVVEGLADADLLVIEANHDRERLRAAPYSWPVKQRIFGPLGHLDNVAAGELLAQLGQDGRKRTAWLAHLSEQANSPHIALKMARSVLSLASVAQIAVEALPRQAPRTWESDRHCAQLELFR